MTRNPVDYVIALVRRSCTSGVSEGGRSIEFVEGDVAIPVKENLHMKRWLIVLTVFLVACSTTGTKGPSDVSVERRVEGNQIYVGADLYAELIFNGMDEDADEPSFPNP